ncbi:MAG TPA: hypothetical protein VM325_13965 [Alphaproteobacteria bacterium]|nr:hypothetical protein [Alphaproteobacteria bacterium]
MKKTRTRRHSPIKKIALSIAAAAAITLGAAGAATAGVSVAKAGLLDGSFTTQTQTVHYRGHRGHRAWRHRRMCRRLRYRGFVLGHWGARRAYYRLCRYRRSHHGY